MLLRLSAETLIISALTVLLLLFVAVDAQGLLSGVRLMVSVVMMFVVPGYLIQKLFPREKADAPEIIGLSFGLSVAVLPILAVVIDLVPFLQLDTATITVALCLFVIGLLLLNIQRTPSRPVGEVFWPGLTWKNIPFIERAALVGVGVSFTAAVFAFVGISFLAAPSDTYTEFYILGEEGLAEAYPRDLRADRLYYLSFGVTNHEKQTTAYRVELHVDGIVTAEYPLFQLGDQETLETTLTFRPETVSAGGRVDLLLYRNFETQPYRALRFFNVPEEVAP